MLLSQMEISTWGRILTPTGRAQAITGDTTITISEGYWGIPPGYRNGTEVFIPGQVSLVVQKHKEHTYFERRNYTKIDERTRDSIFKDILYILKKKEGLDVQDVDLNFHPVENRL